MLINYSHLFVREKPKTCTFIYNTSPIKCQWLPHQMSSPYSLMRCHGDPNGYDTLLLEPHKICCVIFCLGDFLITANLSDLTFSNLLTTFKQRFLTTIKLIKKNPLENNFSSLHRSCTAQGDRMSLFKNAFL